MEKNRTIDNVKVAQVQQLQSGLAESQKQEAELQASLPERDRVSEWRGWAHAIEAVRGSLRGYPDCGGDVEIIKEVERIVEQKTQQLRTECNELRAEVREWLCEECRFVYSGPPQPGIRCVICPWCGGNTGPRALIEKRIAECERDELRAKLEAARRIFVLLRDVVPVDDYPVGEEVRLIALTHNSEMVACTDPYNSTMHEAYENIANWLKELANRALVRIADNAKPDRREGELREQSVTNKEGECHG